MNMREIESIEAGLPVGLRRVLGHLEKERLIAGANRARNECIATSFAKLFARLIGVFESVRKIASDCTAARLGHRIG